MAGSNAVAKASAIPEDLTDILVEDSNSTRDFAREDLAIPFIVILQDLSPQVKSNKAQFIDGARPGMFCNTLSEQLWPSDAGPLIVPVAFQRRYTEWTARNERERPTVVRDHDDASILNRCRVTETGVNVLPNGNEINISAMYYTLCIDPNAAAHSQAVMTFGGTQFKKARKWNTLISSQMIPHPKEQGQKINPPMFYFAYQFSSIPESNDQGDWYGYKIETHGSVFDWPDGSQIYRDARNFRKLITEGRVKPAEMASDTEPDDERPPVRPVAARPAIVDDDIPF